MTSLNSVAYSEVPTLQNEVQEGKVASGTKKDLRVLASREVVPPYNASLVSPVNILPSPVSYERSSIPFPAVSLGQPTTSKKKANPWTCLRENKLLLKHSISCVLSLALYALFLIPGLAHEMNITQARTFVAIISGVAGFSMGFTFMRIIRKFYIATVWATVIHKSKDKGITLQHLVNYSEDPANLVGASKLLYRRWTSQATARKSRRDYDGRLWSLYLVIFMSLYVLSQLMSFALGRAVIITSTSDVQTDKYTEVAIAGDVSDADIEKATTLRPIFNDTETHITWTLTPSTSKPPAISFPWDGDEVYFAETTLSQLVPNGAGLGTATLGYTTKANASVTGPIQNSVKIWYPRWGIRIKCQKLGAENIIPVSSSSYSYLFVPTDVISNLFNAFQKPVPEILQNYDPVLNGTMDPNDTIDESYREGKALGAKFWPNGVASSYYSKLVSNDTDGNGWTTVEAVLVRLNDTYAPNGAFTAYDREDNNGNTTRIGFDAAVCVEVFEPYVLETYNSSALPYSTMIVGKTNNVRGDLGQGSLDGRMLDDEDVHMKLDSTRLYPVYQTLHENSVHMMVKDNGRDAFYIPNPTLVSFSNGTGFQGYTSLDPNLFAKAKASADASNMLPYFAGSQKLLARCYQDQEKASIKVHTALAVFVGGIWFIGSFLCLCVPPLPKDVPRRKFHLYSWVAALLGGELQVLDSKEGKSVVDTRNMSLEDMRREFGNVRIKYNFGEHHVVAGSE